MRLSFLACQKSLYRFKSRWFNLNNAIQEKGGQFYASLQKTVLSDPEHSGGKQKSGPSDQEKIRISKRCMQRSFCLADLYADLDCLESAPPGTAQRTVFDALRHGSCPGRRHSHNLAVRCPGKKYCLSSGSGLCMLRLRGLQHGRVLAASASHDKSGSIQSGARSGHFTR